MFQTSDITLEDVLAICASLNIDKFSLLAHSAGAVYALATALRLPQHVHGTIHLLAPWIPPSQMTSVNHSLISSRVNQLPRSQRLLRVLPTSLLKAANSNFISVTSSSLSRGNLDSPLRPKHRRCSGIKGLAACSDLSGVMDTEDFSKDMTKVDHTKSDDNKHASPSVETEKRDLEQENTTEYMQHASSECKDCFDKQLTLAIWNAATHNANPAVDLMVCLERHRPIGFRYADVHLPVVLHHGSHDTRVPLDNVKWLSRIMHRCELRVISGEGHSLMANAPLMGGVLAEIAKEWKVLP